MQEMSVKELRRVSLLGRLAEALIVTSDVSEFFRFLREKLQELIPAEHVLIYYHDARSRAFVLLPEFNEPEHFGEGRRTRLSYDETPFQKFLKNRTVLMRVEQPDQAPFGRAEKALLGPEVHAEMAVPIATHDRELLGVLQLARNNPIGFNKAQKAVAIAAAAFIANLLERDLLYTRNERLKAEKSWWQTHFDTAFHRFLGAACVVDAGSGLLQSVNARFAALLGAATDSLPGSRLADHLVEASREEVEKALAETQNVEPVLLQNTHLRRDDGGEHRVHLKLQRIPNTSQVLVRVFDAARRQKRRSRQLRQWQKLNQFLAVLQSGSQENFKEDIQKALAALGQALSARYVALFKVRDDHPTMVHVVNLRRGQSLRPDQALKAGLEKGPYERLLEAKEMKFYSNLLEEEAFSAWRPIARQLGFTGILSVPLDLPDRRIGLLCIYFAEKKQIPLQERVLVEASSRYLAMILSHMRLQRKAHQRLDQIKIIEELTRRINAGRSVDDIVREAAVGVQKIIPFDLLDISLFDSEGENVKLYSIISRPLAEKIGVETWRGLENLPEYGWLCLGEAVDPELHAQIEEQVESKRNVLLMANERYLGTLEISSMDARVFKKEHLDFLNQVAGQLATAFDNIRLLEKLKHRVKELVAVARASWAVAGEIDVRAMLVHILQSVRKTLGAQRAEFRLLLDIPDMPAKVVEGGNEEGLDFASMSEVKSRLERQKQYCILGRKDGAVYLSKTWVGNCLLLPVVVHQQTIGVLAAEVEGNRRFTRREVELLRTMSNLIGSALESERLRRISSERTRQLEQVNEELEKFVYTVSHDLKSPIVSIHGFSSILLDDYGDKLDPDARHYLERIQKNAVAMQQLVKDLLELSRVGRGAQNFEDVELRDIVERALLEFSYQIREDQVQVIVQDELPKVHADGTQMTQVFANLIGNAIKFRDPDKKEARVEIGAEEREEEVLCWVKDNGVGIAPEFHDKIFNLFERQPRSKAVEGSGIGLTVVKRIIDLHEGRIWVESEVGEGAAFYFTLPKARSSSEAESSSSA